MSKIFDAKVAIRDEFRKELLFGLEARLPIAMILGLSDHRHEVLPAMQTISHATRAYIINADGLPGFVVSYDISKHL